MIRKDGGTAFPMQDPQAIHAYAQAATEAAKHDNVEDRDQTYLAARAEAIGGMSLRDYFATKALPIAAEEFKRYGDLPFEEECMYVRSSEYESTARAAYALADAMLAERAK